jgi:lipoprotein-anchoring transpeptidase ErfK/SrfK
MRAGLAIVVTVLAALPPAAAAQESGAREVLSDPGHVSRWAFAMRKAIARETPDAHAKAVARLRVKTQDGTDEVMAVLARETDAAGHRWIQVRLPILPNGSTGWVPEDALSGFHKVRTWLRIDTRRLRATLVRSGHVVFRSGVGIGKKGSPTPKGDFYVRDRLEGFPPGSIYGALAFGLNARSAVLTDWPGGGFVGIHGTNQPYLLPGRVSHGCIRMRNRDILRLARLMPVGTPVTVS